MRIEAEFTLDYSFYGLYHDDLDPAWDVLMDPYANLHKSKHGVLYASWASVVQSLTLQTTMIRSVLIDFRTMCLQPQNEYRKPGAKKVACLALSQMLIL